MSGTVWIKHPGLDAVSEVPASALPTWRQAGWDLLSDEELDALEREKVEEAAAAEQLMQQIAEQGAQVEPPLPEPLEIPPASSSEDATSGRRTNKKENG